MRPLAPDEMPVRAADLLPETPSVAHGLVAVLGLWLLASPWLLDYAHTAAPAVDMATGAIVCLLVLAARSGRRPALVSSLLVVAGLLLVLAGIALGRNAVVRLNELVVGVLICGLALLAGAERRAAARR